MEDKQRWAIQRNNERLIKQKFPSITTQSGIYEFYRQNEENEYCCYIGQAKNLLQRIAGHLTGYKKKNATHIDKSLFVHKLYSENNPNGWKVRVLKFVNVVELDKWEKYFIDVYQEKGYKMYNITGGGQFDKAENINETYKVKLKTYANGKKIAYEQVRKEIAKLFEKNLTFSINGKETKNKLKAYKKFEQFLKGGNSEE